MVYERIIRPILFGLSSRDPEKVHEWALSLLHYLGEREVLTKAAENFFTFQDPRLKQEIFGLKFPNPVGLAAGFDKYALALRGLQSLGFGFLEAGAFTRYQQEGEPRPRIFRFPRDKALINRLGFNNDGAVITAYRFSLTGRLKVPLGINLGKSKITPLEDAAGDYLFSLRKLYTCGDYFTVNVSSPNTPGLRKLQGKEYLDLILAVLQMELAARAKATNRNKKPLLVKISPDLSFAAIDELLQTCLDRKVDGLIAVNATIERFGLSAPTSEQGGLSGPPLWPKALAAVHYIHRQTKGELPIVGVGGISWAEQAYEMLRYAHLVQILTSFVYGGPSTPSRLNKGLIKLMERDGIKHISQLRE